MWFWIGGTYEPTAGPFCVHAALVASSVEVGQVAAPGAAAPVDDDEPADGLAIVGQVYCPGVAALADAEPAAGVFTPAAEAGGAFTPGGDEAQAACEDD